MPRASSKGCVLQNPLAPVVDFTLEGHAGLLQDTDRAGITGSHETDDAVEAERVKAKAQTSFASLGGQAEPEIVRQKTVAELDLAEVLENFEPSKSNHPHLGAINACPSPKAMLLKVRVALDPTTCILFATHRKLPGVAQHIRIAEEEKKRGRVFGRKHTQTQAFGPRTALVDLHLFLSSSGCRPGGKSQVYPKKSVSSQTERAICVPNPFRRTRPLVFEVNFDGLVGLTHHYGGLSAGNLASMTHGGKPSSPRRAAHQGLAKMRFVHELGVSQAILPPHPRPDIGFLRRVGFSGSDEAVITAAAQQSPQLLRTVSSAAAMWTANAATVVPGSDTEDGRLHMVVANLQSMLHRTIEADVTYEVLRAIFRDETRFQVHPPLPGGGQFADEGAANHIRLCTPGQRAVHLFAWGRRALEQNLEPVRFPARQTYEASSALVRTLLVDPEQAILPRQQPEGIDLGAFHTDVLAVGNGHLLLMHELAFSEPKSLVAALRQKLGDSFTAIVATSDDLPPQDAISAYPFNSQLLTLPDGSMTIIAPEESRACPSARMYLERIVEAAVGVRQIHYLDLRQSMHNGGGPACLRLRVLLTEQDRAHIAARIFVDDDLLTELAVWIDRHYRDQLVDADLADPHLWRETCSALDELTRIMNLGSIYPFQRTFDNEGR